MITMGFLAPLVLGNAYACIHVASAPRAWPPNYRLLSNREEEEEVKGEGKEQEVEEGGVWSKHQELNSDVFIL